MVISFFSIPCMSPIRDTHKETKCIKESPLFLLYSIRATCVVLLIVLDVICVIYRYKDYCAFKGSLYSYSIGNYSVFMRFVYS